MITTFILLISILVNVLLVWYIRQIIKRLVYMSENVDTIHSSLTGYEEHLKKVYEMETFYGDQTLFGLLEHTKIFQGNLVTIKVLSL